MVSDFTDKKSISSPFPIRFSTDQREILEGQANGRPLGEYIKDVLFTEQRTPQRTNGMVIQDYRLFAKGLALLGESELSQSVNALAEALESGSLPFNGEIVREIQDCVEAIFTLRDTFIQAMGLKAHCGRGSPS